MSDNHDKLNEMQKLKICGRGLNASRSPPHPPSKKAAILDCAQEGFEKKKFKGGTVVHRREGFPGVLKHQGLPRHDIPLTNSSHYMSVLPPSFCVPK